MDESSWAKVKGRPSRYIWIATLCGLTERWTADLLVDDRVLLHISISEPSGTWSCESRR